MTEIHSGQETKAVVRTCPQCSSTSIEEFNNILVGPNKDKTARCHTCDWRGSAAELLSTPFKHEMGSDAQVLHSMVTDLRNVLAKEFAKSFGAFLLKWGFISAGITPKELSQYIVAIAKATMAAILETRQEIEREQKKR